MASRNSPPTAGTRDSPSSRSLPAWFHQMRNWRRSTQGSRNEGGPVWDPEFKRINPEYFDYADRRVRHLVDSGIVPATGDGRLTFRYAMETKLVVGIDTKEQDIQAAARNCRTELRAKVHLLCASGAALPFPAQRFDVVLLASSL